jgi:quinolinate synthase
MEKLEGMSNEELTAYIKEIKKKLGKKIFIPVHHYQGENIVALGDVVGDSYKLAVEASKTEAEFIIFCGVRFMAEGAKILAKDYQKIVMPEVSAGCPMADMANVAQVEEVFKKIQAETGGKTAPLLYINSYADLKNFCGKNNGSICTSSNAGKIIKYFLKEGKAVFFLPDFFLGYNTALDIGTDEKHIARVKSDLSIEIKGDINDVKFFLWYGFCPIHERFSHSDIKYLRSIHPEIKIIVHPESGIDVVEASDFSGSTEKIYNTVKNSPAGSVWGVGTETTFVSRLANENKDKIVLPLRESACANMKKTTLEKLAVSLRSVDDYLSGKSGELLYKIEVDDEYIENAKKALNKMIMIVEEK